MEKHPSAISMTLSTLISHLNWSKSENLEAVQTCARHEIAHMEKGLVILEIATGTGPLLGLLGTLSGLVGVFSALGDNGDPVLVARGISEALNTTIAGLAVAVGVAAMVTPRFTANAQQVDGAIDLTAPDALDLARNAIQPPDAPSPMIMHTTGTFIFTISKILRAIASA
jgi:biopolymer transport protein ExbB/TolQ